LAPHPPDPRGGFAPRRGGGGGPRGGGRPTPQALYWIPQLDVLWDVYGFNYVRAWKNVDCLHQTYFPDLFAHTYDAMTLAVLDHRHRCPELRRSSDALAPDKSDDERRRASNFAVIDRGTWGFDDTIATVSVATPQVFVDRLVFAPLSMPRGPAWSRDTFVRKWRYRLNND